MHTVPSKTYNFQTIHQNIFGLYKVDLGVMTMIGYSTLPKSLELEHLYQIQFSVIIRTPFFVGGVLFLGRGDSLLILSPTDKTSDSLSLSLLSLSLSSHLLPPSPSPHPYLSSPSIHGKCDVENWTKIITSLFASYPE